MAKRLVDIDDDSLEIARAELGCATIKDTVNTALRLVADRRRGHADAAFEFMSRFVAEDRTDAWR